MTWQKWKKALVPDSQSTIKNVGENTHYSFQHDVNLYRPNNYDKCFTLQASTY